MSSWLVIVTPIGANTTTDMGKCQEHPPRVTDLRRHQDGLCEYERFEGNSAFQTSRRVFSRPLFSISNNSVIILPLRPRFGDCGTGRMNIYHHTDRSVTE